MSRNVWVTAGAVAIAGAAWAQPADPQAIPVFSGVTPELSKVVVTASRSQALVEQMPLHTTIVSQEDIQKSPAQTLDQLLRSVPGLNFTGVPATQSDPTGHQTRMRGMGNAKVLVLLDGVPVHDPFYLTTQWFKVPLSNIDHVEIVRGGNSSLWGNMAVAGVVNIVSKRPKDNSGEAAISAGSRGSHALSLSKNFQLSEALSFNLVADQLNSQGYQTVPADQLWRYPDRQPADAKLSNLQFSTYFKPSSELQGYVRLGYHVQDQDISYRYGSNLQKNPDLAGSVTRRLDDKSNLTANVWAQNVSFEKYNGASCYWQAAAATKCPSNSAVTPAQVNNQIVQYYTQYGSQRYRERGASGIYSNDLGGVLQSLQLGLDYRRLSATDLENFYGAPTVQTTLPSVASSTYGQAEQTFTGLFAQTRLRPTPPLELTLSARLDHWSNTGRVNTRTAGATTTGGAQPDNTKSGVNPSLAVRYTVHDDLALRAASYKSFRAPGFNNTTRTFGSPNPTIANPDLGPENLTGRELGLDYSHGPLTLGATWFVYDIKNMIATYKVTAANASALVQTICGGPTLPICGTPGQATFYTNDQDGRSQGLELTGKWEATPTWTLDGSYTLTSTVLTRKGYVSNDPLNVQLAGTPRQVASLGATWLPAPGWSSYVQARHVGRMGIDSTTTVGTVYEQGGFTVFDVSVKYAWSKAVDLTASAINLLDKTYSENAYTYNQPWSRTLSQPRTLQLGLKARF